MKLAAAVLKNILLVVVLILSALFVLQYVVNTKYTFPEPHPFSGSSLYNPYSAMDSAKWKKANFHVHTQAWLNLTNGHANTSELVDSLYKYLGYDIINISDYERINTFESANKWFVPEYEHGYLFSKNHQLVLNAKEPSWLDYLYPQTLDNEQHVINRLKEDTADLVAIAHPRLRNSYSTSDFKYLCGYDCIEILNQNRFSIAHLDSALSSGHPAFILADDDAHDLSDIYQGGRCCNFINTDIDKTSIIQALKCGNSFGADIYMHNFETYKTKKEIISQLPILTEIKVAHDTLTIALNKTVRSFVFIGQGGVSKAKVLNAATGAYVFNKEDTYIRTEITCDEGTVYYLNPVFRYDGQRLPANTATVNVSKTWTWRIVFALVLCVLFIAWRRLK